MSISRKTVRSSAELESCWRELIEPLGFSSRQLFAIVMDSDGEVFPHLINITDCPESPEQAMVANFVEILRDVSKAAGSNTSCAVVWARPTPSGCRESDLIWARSLARELARVGLARWPIHVANDSVLQVVGPDDLQAA